MDNIIQGLNQSPIVQSLSEVSHNLKRVVHDIPDNAPYRTLHKRVLQPTSGDRDDPNSTLNFTIPRHGNLIRMYLKASLYFPFQPNAPGSSQSDNDKAMGPHFFASFLTNASLFIGGRCVETLLPENILANAYQSNTDVVDNVLLGLKGRWSEYNENILGSGHEDIVSQGAGVKLQKYANFLIPLDFSLMRFHKDSIDTRVLQKMQVEIQKRGIQVFQTQLPGAYTKCQLVCKFYDLDQSFRNEIRNTNYPEVKSSLLTYGNYLITEHTYSSVPDVIGGQIDTEIEDLGSANTFEILEFDGINPSIFGAASLVDFITPPYDMYFFKPQGFDVDDTRFPVTETGVSEFTIPFLPTTSPGKAVALRGSDFGLTVPGKISFRFYNANLVDGDLITIENAPDWVAAGFTTIEGDWTITKIVGPSVELFHLDSYPDHSSPLFFGSPSGENSLEFERTTVVDNTFVLEQGYQTYTFDLNQSFGFITEMLVSFKNLHINDVNDFAGDIVSTPTQGGFLRFKLMVEDRIIYEKNHWEMLMHTQDMSNLDIQDVTEQAYGLKIFHSGDDMIPYIHDSIDLAAEQLTTETATRKHAANMYRIPFTLFHGEEFQNGGLNLNLLTNVKLIIEGSDLFNRDTQEGVTPQLVLRRRNLNRVDGRTGSIHSTFN